MTECQSREEKMEVFGLEKSGERREVCEGRERGGTEGGGRGVGADKWRRKR